MSMDRRQFLKITGISSILGLGASVASATHPIWMPGVDPDLVSPNAQALTAKRWGMAVDMTKFRSEADIKRVVEACHSIHNVPDFGNNPDGTKNIKDEIKWIWKAKFKQAFPEQATELNEHLEEAPFLVFCNHCDNPACVRVCPTKATFKRDDGAVMMDMHRCIGCRFCMAACPYGARSFNWRDPRPFIKKEKQNRKYPTRTKGVVEKCTFCTERLAVGQMPACVEKAPPGGLVFGDLDDPKSAIRRLVSTRYTIRRKPELGTGPNIYYVIGGR
ncbi:MAG TPA: 4Fe-4S ferredoxin [Nitrospiraceae bacterium]|nr:4Fe-4S ferredoxin [Nitrospiraceae bacterium]